MKRKLYKVVALLMTLAMLAGLALSEGELDALDTGILEEMGAEEDEGGKSLRGAMTDCLWKKMNRTLVEFAESRTLADILQECRKRSAEWDMYVI